MVLFISAYPDASNEKEGLVQRVAAIDSLFAEKERIYLHISYKRHWIPKKVELSPLLTVYRLNLYLHFPMIAALARRASTLYVHSVYNSVRVLPLYFFFPVVTDMHGLVPEELKMEGRLLGSRWFSLVESIAFRRSCAIVAVTEKMAQYLREKYHPATPEVFRIPIFDTASEGADERSAAEGKTRVIYAGGAQKWQNVDLMLSAIRQRVDDFEWTILTGDIDFFKDRLSRLGLLDKVMVESVPKQEVYEYYREADLGFVLRDDISVNRVACPTKLVEYLSCGVVPVVLQPEIGDFSAYGYSYVTLDELLNGKMPGRKELAAMAQRNAEVVERMNRDRVSEAARLLAWCAE